MDDINIASTLSGMYTGLANQADARSRAGYYNSLSAMNQQNMPIQAQSAANQNVLSQQAIQRGQMGIQQTQGSMDEDQQAKADNQFAADAYMRHHTTSVDQPAQPTAAVTPTSQTTANPSPVMQGQGPAQPSVAASAPPTGATSTASVVNPTVGKFTTQNIDPSLISKGLVEPGNIPLVGRPLIDMGKGQVGSEYSVSFTQDGKEVLVPTIFDGKTHTPQEAWQHYLDTGQHMGKYDNPQDADAAATLIHQREYAPGGSLDQSIPRIKTTSKPFPPVNEQDLLAHYKGSLQTSASPTPVIASVSSTLAKVPNSADTSDSVRDNPTFAATHTFDSVDPTSGKVTHNTFDRQGYIDELMKNPRLADAANQLQRQWTTQDAADQLTKSQAKVAKTSQLLGLVSIVANAAPAHQQAAFDFMLKQAKAQGLDVSSLQGTDLSTPEGQVKLDYLNKAAQADAATGTASLAVAKNANDTLKAQAAAQLQGAQVSEVPSKIGLNQAEAAKALADAAKAKQESAWLAGSGSGLPVPSQYQGIVDKLASGQLQLSDLPARTGLGQVPKTQLLAWTIGQHPDWNPSMNAQQKKTITDFAPNGTSGKAIASLGAIAEHTQLLRQSYDAMQNGDIPTLNKLAGSLGAEVGGSAKTTYDNMASVYAGEVDKAFSGNNPTEGGAKTWAHNLNYGMSPAQAKGAFDILDNAVVGKMQPFDQAYYNAAGKHLSDTNLLTPAAKGLAGKFAPQAQVTPSTQPNVASVAPIGTRVTMKDGTTKTKTANGWE